MYSSFLAPKFCWEVFFGNYVHTIDFIVIGKYGAGFFL